MRFFSALLISKHTCGSVSTSLADLTPALQETCTLQGGAAAAEQTWQ